MLGIGVSMGGVASRRSPVSAFSPAALFAAGERGAWYDPSDLSSLFQDAAGATRVTAAGQPVGLMRDKSGRGNHASQTTTAARPILRQDEAGRFYLAFDGVDDSMKTAAIDLTVTDKLTLVLAQKMNALTPSQILAELSADYYQNPGSFCYFAANTSFNGATYALKASGGAGFSFPPSTNTEVHSVLFDIAGAGRATEVFIRKNGAIPVLTGQVGTNAGTGSFGNYPLFLGRRNGVSNAFNGRFYGLILRGAASPADVIASAEKYLNERAGAYAEAKP